MDMQSAKYEKILIDKITVLVVPFGKRMLGFHGERIEIVLMSAVVHEELMHVLKF